MNNKSNAKYFDKVLIKLASPQDIRKWSYGEILKPETINYKNYKPEKNGLFDERIFGPVRNYECYCGKYKKIKNKGRVCERCGVEIIESIVRRYRMGHVELAEPVAHIWMYKTSPNHIAILLNMDNSSLEDVIYFVSFIVVEKGDSFFSNKTIININQLGNDNNVVNMFVKTLNKIIQDNSDNEEIVSEAKTYIQYITNLDENFSFYFELCFKFLKKYSNVEISIGASAIRSLLEKINIEEDLKDLKLKYKNLKSASSQLKLKFKQRIQIFNKFKRSKVKPEWMVLTVLPVIPPDIRPIIQLDGGRFTSSEINDLYRRIIIRNERLKKIKEIDAPMIIINNEKRLLQEAVDALLDNEKREKPYLTKDKRVIKSLSTILKGKTGRFRQNLLGKRVDYSARSVIVTGPTLNLNECKLPRDMALILFKPYVINKLLENQHASNLKQAEKLIDEKDNVIWKILSKIIHNHPVLLNRAPTLHRLGIQAFYPRLTKDKAIKIPPLCTSAFNADFDGDQMAVHVPLSKKARDEAANLMIASKNILGLKDGKSIVTPSQDMILGYYWLTTESKETLGAGMLFSSIHEVKTAFENKQLHLQSVIGIDAHCFKDKFPNFNFANSYILITTMGKILFNEIFEDEMYFLNDSNFKYFDDTMSDKYVFELNKDFKMSKIIEDHELTTPFKKKTISIIVDNYFVKFGQEKTSIMLNKLKDVGFKYSTLSGITLSFGDLKIYDKKEEIFDKHQKKVDEINNFFDIGWLAEEERYNNVVKIYGDFKEEVTQKVSQYLKEHKENSLFIIGDSSARGNILNFVQLIGARGLMKNSKGEVIEVPIKSCFKEGMTVFEFFVSTYGARKVMVDTALKTADAGYLTRRLVDATQEVIITEFDCHNTEDFYVSDIFEKHTNTLIVSLYDRIFGRSLKEDLRAPGTDEVIAVKNSIIDLDILKKIESYNFTKINIRSVLTCKTKFGVCRICYGVDLSTGKLAEQGLAIGVIAAQSIGEPGTQLTMRTFHTGGVLDVTDITQGLPRVKELFDVVKPKGKVAIISKVDGVITKIQKKEHLYKIVIQPDNEKNTIENTCLINRVLLVKENDKVVKGQKLTEGPINLKELLEVGGIKMLQKYILQEIQSVYRDQGIEINDKYIEIIIRQMFIHKVVVNPGDSDFVVGNFVKLDKILKINEKLIQNNEKPIKYKDCIMGIKKIPIYSESFLSAASFQNTTKVLVNAALNGKEDDLNSLKENVILGNLIPVGSGYVDKARIEIEEDVLTNVDSKTTEKDEKNEKEETKGKEEILTDEIDINLENIFEDITTEKKVNTIENNKDEEQDN